MHNQSYIERRRTCLIYSPGGHFQELLDAIDGITFENCFHVSFASPHFSTDDLRHYLTHPRKSFLRTILNAMQSFIMLWRKRPALIVSTGADVAVPTIILGKVFFGCKVIFVESVGSVEPTLTGRLVYKFADLFIVQLQSQLKYYPNAILKSGSLL